MQLGRYCAGADEGGRQRTEQDHRCQPPAERAIRQLADGVLDAIIPRLGDLGRGCRGRSTCRSSVRARRRWRLAACVNSP